MTFASFLQGYKGKKILVEIATHSDGPTRTVRGTLDEVGSDFIKVGPQIIALTYIIRVQVRG